MPPTQRLESDIGVLQLAAADMRVPLISRKAGGEIKCRPHKGSNQIWCAGTSCS